MSLIDRSGYALIELDGESKEIKGVPMGEILRQCVLLLRSRNGTPKNFTMTLSLRPIFKTLELHDPFAGIDIMQEDSSSEKPSCPRFLEYCSMLVESNRLAATPEQLAYLTQHMEKHHAEWLKEHGHIYR